MARKTDQGAGDPGMSPRSAMIGAMLAILDEGDAGDKIGAARVLIDSGMMYEDVPPPDAPALIEDDEQQQRKAWAEFYSTLPKDPDRDDFLLLQAFQAAAGKPFDHSAISMAAGAAVEAAGEDRPPAFEQVGGIGWAVKQMRFARRVCRGEGWNGRGMYLYLVHPDYDPSSPLTPQPYVAMKTAQDMIVPWICSQSDLLATDWQLAG